MNSSFDSKPSTANAGRASFCDSTYYADECRFPYRNQDEEPVGHIMYGGQHLFFQQWSFDKDAYRGTKHLHLKVRAGSPELEDSSEVYTWMKRLCRGRVRSILDKIRAGQASISFPKYDYNFPTGPNHDYRLAINFQRELSRQYLAYIQELASRLSESEPSEPFESSDEFISFHHTNNCTEAMLCYGKLLPGSKHLYGYGIYSEDPNTVTGKLNAYGPTGIAVKTSQRRVVDLDLSSLCQYINRDVACRKGVMSWQNLFDMRLVLDEERNIDLHINHYRFVPDLVRGAYLVHNPMRTLSISHITLLLHPTDEKWMIETLANVYPHLHARCGEYEIIDKLEAEGFCENYSHIQEVEDGFHRNHTLDCDDVAQTLDIIPDQPPGLLRRTIDSCAVM